MTSLLAMVYLIVFGSWLAFSAYVWLLQVAPTSVVSTYAYVNPVVAVFLGWAVLSEPISVRTLAAGAIILGAVALIVTPARVRSEHPVRRPRRSAPSSYAGPMTTVDLRRLGLRPGEELADEHEVEIAPLELGGQRYVCGARARARRADGHAGCNGDGAPAPPHDAAARPVLPLPR